MKAFPYGESMHKFDRNRLNFIIDAAKFIISEEVSDNNLKIQYAVILSMITLCEAAAKFGSQNKENPRAAKEKFKGMPWVDLENIRNYLAHEYFWFDLAKVHTELRQYAEQLSTIADDILNNKGEKFQNPPTLFPYILGTINYKESKESEQSKEPKAKKRKIESKESSEAQQLSSSDQRRVKSLERILKELANIEEFTQSEKEDYSEVTLYTVEMAVIIISNEAKNSLGRDFTAKFPLELSEEDITWSNLISKGNSYIHNYYNVDYEDVYLFCENKLHYLKTRIETIKQQYLKTIQVGETISLSNLLPKDSPLKASEQESEKAAETKQQASTPGTLPEATESEPELTTITNKQI